MQKMIDILGASQALSVETGLAVLASLVITIIAMIVFRRISPVQRIVLPGLELTRGARDYGVMLLKIKDRELEWFEVLFIAFTVIGYAIRGAFSLLFAAVVFFTMMTAVAPLMAI